MKLISSSDMDYNVSISNVELKLIMHALADQKAMSDLAMDDQYRAMELFREIYALGINYPDTISPNYMNYENSDIRR